MLWRLVNDATNIASISSREEQARFTDAAICEEVRFKNDDGEWVTAFRSFDFKPNASAKIGPSYTHLQIALQDVVQQGPQCKGFI